ncbi:XMAP215 family protein [Trypanosoma grayi]|uniref:XMAP215 family protein n=1 Tax=Trypanosoma grayi TaxID=71804 RepID=UPI0004F47E73|nr:XMAP215 family protein [Trypanosoma grayi]KEG14083.1 XMAP215 family protein [Trypanosoma grayi]
MEYDEVAVSSRQPTGPGAVEPPCEDFNSLTLDALLTHANWKARKEGFERVRDDPKNLKVHLLEKPKKLLGESNAAAQEALFEAFGALVNCCDDDELDVLAGLPLKAVLEKGIVGRPKAVQVSFAFVSDLVGAAKQTAVFDALLPVFSHKAPKSRMAATQLCSQLVGEYGVQGIPAKAILKAMQPLFNDANAQVRKEAAGLCCQCYRYIGTGIKGFLTDLREVQLQELEKMFEDIVVGEVPPKTIRGQAPSTPIKTTAPLHLVSHGGPSNDIDDTAYELYDEAPVLTKLPRNFYRVALDKTAKWQDRVAMVQDNLLPLIAAPKIRLKDDYHELTSMVRELLIDPQAPLMLMGFKCIQELARALRTTFAPHARAFLTPLFDKMKDKKTSVVEHITTTLEALIRYKCITLDQCQDEIEVTMQSRVPNQRLALTQWLSRLIDKLDCSHFHRLSRAHQMLGRLLNDEKVEIREASYTLVAKLMSLVGDASFQPLLLSLDEKQRARLVVAVNSAANLQCTPTCSPAKKTQRIERREGSASAKPRSLSIGVMNSSGAPNGNTVRGQRPASAMPRRSSPDMRKRSSTDDAVALESTLLSKDEALKRMLGLMNGDTTVLPLLRSKEWSNRYNGIMKIRAVVDEWSENKCTQYLDTIVVYLRVDPGWRESIFQVFQAMLGVIQEVVTRATAVSAGAGNAIIAGCIFRLTEPKNKPVVRDLLTCLAKSLGVAFVLRHMIAEVVPVKTPRLLQECNEFMTQLLQSFQAPRIDAKNVVDYVKMHCLDQPSPAVRSSGVALLVGLRLSVGPIVDSYIGNVSAVVRNTYDEGISNSNVEGGTSRRASGLEIQRTNSPISSSRVQARSPARGTTKQNIITASAAATPLPNTEIQMTGSRRFSNNPQYSNENEEDSGRTDVSQQLLFLAKQIMGEADWRVRLNAIKKVEELMLGSNKFITQNGVVEILRALRTRFDESNKNFVIDVLRTTALVMESAGPAACRPELKNILQGVLGMLGDQKANLREEATKVAYLSLEYLGLDAVLQYMLKPLTAESPTCNQTALELIERGFKLDPEASVSRPVVALMVPSVVRLCMNRILEVRSAAERVIGYFIPIVGDEAVLRAVQSLRPAEQQSVMTSIERQLQLYLRVANEEEVRHTAALPALTSSRCLSGSTPRSPHTASRDMSVSHRSTDQLAVPAQGSSSSFNTGVRQSFAQEPPRSVPTTISATRAARPNTRSDEFLSIQEIMVGLRSASSSTACSTCAEFMERLQSGEDCGTPEMIQVMVERLYENAKNLDVGLALSLISCLKAIFETPRCSQRCHSSLLYRMLGIIFDCLLSEPFSLQEGVIKALNNMTLRLLEGCPGNDVFSALMSRMTRYSATYSESGKKTDFKYIQVTVKCLMRLDFDSVSPDNVVLCCHEYLLQHPPSAFRNLDDLSIRTVKTILQDLSRRCGPPLLTVADRLVGTQNLVTHFIRACLETRERAVRANNTNDQQVSTGAIVREQQSISPGQQGNALRPRAIYVDPQAVPTTSGIAPTPQRAHAAVVEEKSVATIFGRIRNHVTSNEGIEELYAYLKHHSRSPEFDQQFQRCSEAFRSYIKRKMERQMIEDPAKPPGFALPDILRSVP